MFTVVLCVASLAGCVATLGFWSSAWYWKRRWETGSQKELEFSISEVRLANELKNASTRVQELELALGRVRNVASSQAFVLDQELERLQYRRPSSSIVSQREFPAAQQPRFCT